MSTTHWIAQGPTSCDICSTRESAIKTLVSRYGVGRDPGLTACLDEFGQALAFDYYGDDKHALVELVKCECTAPAAHVLMAQVEGRVKN